MEIVLISFILFTHFCTFARAFRTCCFFYLFGMKKPHRPLFEKAPKTPETRNVVVVVIVCPQTFSHIVCVRSNCLTFMIIVVKINFQTGLNKKGADTLKANIHYGFFNGSIQWTVLFRSNTQYPFETNRIGTVSTKYNRNSTIA